MNLNKTTYHHGNLRETLITSALEILKDGTLEDLSLRALARKAGVSQTAPYRHFEDREALIVVLILEGSKILRAGMRTAVEISSDPVESMLECGLNYYDFAAAHPALFRIMFGGNINELREKYPELQESEQKSRKIIQPFVSECMKLKTAPHKAEELIMISYWSLAHGLSHLLLNDVDSTITGRENQRVVVREVLSLTLTSMFKK
jgi:AcrR family transcriptional regulator